MHRTRLTSLTLAAASVLLAAFAFTPLTGCQNGPDLGQLATPARIQAVTALGSYYGAKAAIRNGHRAGVERALEGLQSIQASGPADLPAIVKAIGDAGITFFDSPEGQLTLGAVVTFSDAWAGTAQPILDAERTRAFLAGTLRGFELALANTQTRALASDHDTTADTLIAEAVKTRSTP